MSKPICPNCGKHQLQMYTSYGSIRMICVACKECFPTDKVIKRIGRAGRISWEYLPNCEKWQQERLRLASNVPPKAKTEGRHGDIIE